MEPQPVGGAGAVSPRRAIDRAAAAGYVAAGVPIEAVVGSETIAVPEDLVGKRDTYVLRVKGDSMIDEQIRDGDYVIVEDRRTADNGEMVIALVNGSDVTLKKLYREQGHIRLQPANPAMQPILVRARPGPDPGRGHRRDASLLIRTARSTILGHERTQANQLHDRAGRWR